MTTSVLEQDAADLFGLTAALVAIPSESHHEAELAKIVEERLRTRAPSLAIDTVGANVVARTMLGRDRRVVVGGHLDPLDPTRLDPMLGTGPSGVELG